MYLRIVCICVALLGAASSEAAKPAAHEPEWFVTSDNCIACHSGLRTRSGEDVSIGFDWRSTIMANSARDPYWHAAVRREVMDHPAAREAIEDKCSTCHMPMARFDAASHGGRGEVFANIAPSAASHAEAFDGVSCTVCHQIEPDNLGTRESLDGGFEIDTANALGTRPLYGPYDVTVGHGAVMRSAARFVPQQSEHIRQSELCATCHTLYTTTLDDAGEVIGELPEQVPYQEWLASEYRATRSCQSCHMPAVDEEIRIASVLGQPRPRLAQHTFRGGNAFVLGLLNKYRGELGVRALPQELDAAVRETREYLATAAATIRVEDAALRGGELGFTVAVESSTGHKLPTAYPARRAWLHVRVLDARGAAVFESGAVRPDGSIVGNANDEDELAFEPHYEEISRPDQVQIYESIMVDRNGRVTTGLLSGMRYEKDNRLLPKGFDKRAADEEVAVHGGALDDADFGGGGDRVRYRVALPRDAGAAFTIEAELLYESIGFRWAENLKDYDADEPRRFVRYYTESAADAAIPLARAQGTVARR